MKVGLLCSEKWISKCIDNELLISEYQKKGIDAIELCWENPTYANRLDFVVVRSTWGYQERCEQYLCSLKYISEKTRLFNSFEDIKSNIYKDDLFRSLISSEIPCAKTVVVDSGIKQKQFLDVIHDSFNGITDIVVKPYISASGDGVKRFKAAQLIEAPWLIRLSNYNNSKKLIVQEYIEDINYGELSLVFFEGEYSHALKRFPGILAEKKHTIECSPDNSIIQFAYEVINTLGLQTCLYARIDVVITNNGPIIMEVEINEPDLFIRKTSNWRQIAEVFVDKSITKITKKY